MEEMTARVLAKMEEFEQIGIPNLEEACSEADQITYGNINIHKLQLARGFALLGPKLKVGGFQQHRQPQYGILLHFKTARFFDLIILLLVQATRVEAHGSNWDSNYLIIFGITILIAIIIISVIASLCYCICRFTDEASNANILPAAAEPELLELPLSVQRAGCLDAATIKTFPEIPFGEGGHVDSCSICKDDFIDGEILRGLPQCTHRYHDHCIRQWLTTVKASCPVCRHDYGFRLASVPV